MSERRINNRNVVFIAVFHHRHWKYTGKMTTNCVHSYLSSLCVFVFEWEAFFFFLVSPCGTLILSLLSNYLNCAYRSSCAVHFPPVESHSRPSFTPAALATERSTLGISVLHIKPCTCGMFMRKKKKNRIESKTALKPNHILFSPSFFFDALSSHLLPRVLAPDFSTAVFLRRLLRDFTIIIRTKRTANPPSSSGESSFLSSSNSQKLKCL